MRIFLLFRTVRLIGGLILIAVWAASVTVHADSYQVNASVPYPTPTQAATFDGSQDGTTVQTALQTLSGTCQIQNPVNTVVISRSGGSIGSAPCTSGSYSVQVTLVEGTNTLVARTANASGQYGPDSPSITMTLYLPPTVTPTPATPTPTAPASTPDEVIAKTNSGAAADLTITPSEPFGVMNEQTNAVTLKVTIGGGTTPYTVRINWGDGSVDTHHVDQSGVYEFSHTYQAAGNYTVRGSVQDVLGATTVFNYAVVSRVATAGSTPLDAGAKAGQTAGTTPGWHRLVTPAAVVGGLAALVAGGYWLGVHHMAGQLFSQQSGKRPSRPTARRASKSNVRRRR
jgi:hypothetical protein